MMFSKVIAVLGMVLVRTLTHVDAANVVCGYNTVTVTFAPADANVLGVQNGNVMAVNQTRPLYNELGPLDPLCQDTYVPEGVTMTFQLGSCDPVITQTDVAITYCWTMWKVLDPRAYDTVARFKQAYMEFKCEYARYENVTATFQPTIMTTGFSTTALGWFDFSLNFFGDSARTVPLVGDVVVPDRIYAQLILNIGAPGSLTALVRKCWATPTSDPTVLTPYGSYCFIDNYCGVVGSRTDPNGVSKVTQAGNSTEALFDFLSFVFMAERENYTTIWIHCEACVCDTDLDGCAPQPLPCIASDKKKREIADDDTYTTRLVTTGPLHIVPAPKTCNKNNGECAEICTMEEEKVVCSCPGSLRLADDRRSCIKTEAIVADKVLEVHEPEEEFLDLDATKVFVVAALLFSTFLIAVIVFMRCNRLKLDKPRSFQTA